MLELLTDTRVDLARSGVRHGAGLFETIRIHHGVPLRLDAHLARLGHGAAFLGMDDPPDVDELRSFIEARTPCPSLQCGVLRLLAVDGKLMIFTAPWQPQRPAHIEIGLSWRITRFSRNPLNKFKTMAYLENLLLMREAEDRACFDMIAINEAGRLTDGGRTNLFVVNAGRVLTPPTEDGALPGVARQALLLAGLAEEASLTPEDLKEAEAVFLTNALQGVIPVQSVEARIRKHRLPASAKEAEAILLPQPCASR